MNADVVSASILALNPIVFSLPDDGCPHVDGIEELSIYEVENTGLSSRLDLEHRIEPRNGGTNTAERNCNE